MFYKNPNSSRLTLVSKPWRTPSLAWELLSLLYSHLEVGFIRLNSSIFGNIEGFSLSEVFHFLEGSRVQGSSVGFPLVGTRGTHLPVIRGSKSCLEAGGNNTGIFFPNNSLPSVTGIEWDQKHYNVPEEVPLGGPWQPPMALLKEEWCHPKETPGGLS